MKIEFCENCENLLEFRKLEEQPQWWCKNCSSCPVCNEINEENCLKSQEREKKEIEEEIINHISKDDRVRLNPRQFEKHPGPDPDRGWQDKNLILSKTKTILSISNEEQQRIPDYGKTVLVEGNSIDTVKGKFCPNCHTESLKAMDLPVDRFNDEQSTSLIQCINCSFTTREGR